MAQHYLKNSPINMGLSVAHVTAGSTAVSTADTADVTEYESTDALDTELASNGAPYNVAGYLDSLTFNDKVYALKLINDTTNYPQV